MLFEELKPHWNAVLKARAFFSYYRCPRCGLLFCPRFFSAPELQALYGDMPDNTLGLPIEGMKSTQRGYFNILKRYFPLPGAYLEIGPDLGLFTRYCAAESSYNHFWLFEPKTDVQPALNEALAGKSYRIVPSMFDAGVLAEASVSTVVMIHVLDHLLEPRKMLEDLKPKLLPGAILLLVTHDESSFLARLMKAKWGGYSLEHPQLFRPDSLRALLQSAGFRVEAIEKTYNHFPLTHLLNQVLFLAGLKKTRLPPMKRFVIPLKLGNILTVARYAK